MNSNDYPELKAERRRSDTLSHIVNFLFFFILSGLAWWMNKIDIKADRVPILEERVANLQYTLARIEAGVDKLLKR